MGDSSLFDLASDPPKTLQLVRHAKSSWADSSLSDIDRPLSARGKQAAKSLARHLREIEQRPDLVWCSSAKRARQTLKAIRGSFGPDTVVEVDPFVYDADSNDLVKALRDVPSSVGVVMVVGHNPTLQELAIHLVAQDDSEELTRLRENVPTGAMITVALPGNWNRVSTGCARLLNLWTPR